MNATLAVVYLLVAGILVVLAVGYGLTYLIKNLLGAKRPNMDPSIYLNRLGIYSLFFAALQLAVVPLLVVGVLDQSHLTIQEKIAELVSEVLYQLALAALLFVNGRLLRSIDKDELQFADRPLKWLSIVAVVGLVLSLIGLFVGGQSGDGTPLLLIILACLIGQSRAVLRRADTKPAEPVPAKSKR